MNRIAFPTELDINGPWLIDGKHLAELDAVLDRCVEKMRLENTRLKNEDFEARILERGRERNLTEAQIATSRAEFQKTPQYPWDLDKRSITVYLSGGRTVEATKFSEIVAVPNFQNEVPRGFTAVAKVGVTETKVQLTSRWKTLEIRTSPPDNEVALETFGLLQNWQSDFGPKRWQQIWLRYSWVFPMLAFLWFFSGTALLTGLAAAAPQSQIKEEARQLLRQGINPSNQLRAEQLLLEIESDYVPDQVAPGRITARMWATFAIGVVFFVALSFCPKLSIGIWAGRAELQRNLWWVKFIWFTIPILLLTRVAFPWLPFLLGLNPK
jgi:hypothetical protein